MKPLPPPPLAPIGPPPGLSSTHLVLNPLLPELSPQHTKTVSTPPQLQQVTQSVSAPPQLQPGTRTVSAPPQLQPGTRTVSAPPQLQPGTRTVSAPPLLRQAIHLSSSSSSHLEAVARKTAQHAISKDDIVAAAAEEHAAMEQAKILAARSKADDLLLESDERASKILVGRDSDKAADDTKVLRNELVRGQFKEEQLVRITQMAAQQEEEKAWERQSPAKQKLAVLAARIGEKWALEAKQQLSRVKAEETFEKSSSMASKTALDRMALDEANVEEQQDLQGALATRVSADDKLLASHLSASEADKVARQEESLLTKESDAASAVLRLEEKKVQAAGVALGDERRQSRYDTTRGEFAQEALEKRTQARAQAAEAVEAGERQRLTVLRRVEKAERHDVHNYDAQVHKLQVAHEIATKQSAEHVATTAEERAAMAEEALQRAQAEAKVEEDAAKKAEEVAVKARATLHADMGGHAGAGAGTGVGESALEAEREKIAEAAEKLAEQQARDRGTASRAAESAGQEARAQSLAQFERARVQTAVDQAHSEVQAARLIATHEQLLRSAHSKAKALTASAHSAYSAATRADRDFLALAARPHAQLSAGESAHTAAVLEAHAMRSLAAAHAAEAAQAQVLRGVQVVRARDASTVHAKADATRAAAAALQQKERASTAAAVASKMASRAAAKATALSTEVAQLQSWIELQARASAQITAANATLHRAATNTTSTAKATAATPAATPTAGARALVHGWESMRRAHRLEAAWYKAEAARAWGRARALHTTMQKQLQQSHGEEGDGEGKRKQNEYKDLVLQTHKLSSAADHAKHQEKHDTQMMIVTGASSATVGARSSHSYSHAYLRDQVQMQAQAGAQARWNALHAHTHGGQLTALLLVFLALFAARRELLQVAAGAAPAAAVVPAAVAPAEAQKKYGAVAAEQGDGSDLTEVQAKIFDQL